MSASPRAALGLFVTVGLALGFYVTADRAEAGSLADVTIRQTQPSLVEIMQQLEVDMERIAHGVWVADFDSIAAGAQGIADHPKVGPEERARIMEILGDRAAGFREADMFVHETAVELVEQARTESLGAVIDAMTRLEAGCVACHTGYRAPIQQAAGS